MERKGWIRSEEGRLEHNRRARLYTLSDPGRTSLEEEQQGWHQFRRVG